MDEKEPFQYPTLCLAVVGSEASLCLEVPTQDARDALVNHLNTFLRWFHASAADEKNVSKLGQDQKETRKPHSAATMGVPQSYH